MGEEVIELSISETQALRAKLGLPPLRGVPSSSSSSSSNYSGPPPPPSSNDHVPQNNNISSSSGNNKEELVLSIDETNALRLKIGLPPLNNTQNRAGEEEKEKGSSASTAIHAPPTNSQSEREARKRIEDMAAKREANERLRELERENNNESSNAAVGKGGSSAADFAARMMMMTKSDDNDDKQQRNNKKKKKKKKKTMTNSNPQLSMPLNDEDEEEVPSPGGEYTSADLHGIKVSHATSDFTAGTTTVLTLADKSILDIDPDSNKVRGFAHHGNNTGGGGGGGGGAMEEENELVNVNMDSDSKALVNLKRKRQIEMGAGRAGGYAGYDDDEFEELGGVGTASAATATAMGGGGGGKSARGESRRGFAIGADGTATATTANDESKSKNDIFGGFSGGAISLQSRHGNKVVASDFMTYDEEENNDGNNAESKEERLEKERKKQMKMLEKMRKKDKKKAKKSRKSRKSRKRSSDSENDEDSGDEGAAAASSGGNLLQSLEATAVVVDDATLEERKRRRRNDAVGDVNNSNQAVGGGADDPHDDASTTKAAVDDDMTQKRKRFDQIMAKGKVRTDRAFNKPFSALPGSSSSSRSTNKAAGDDGDGADDDAFLNAALAKARRLKRLKELNSTKASSKADTDATRPVKTGEEAVVQAVAKLKQEEEEAAAKGGGNGEPNNANNSGGITFEFDEMQEFTRALRARENQAKRGVAEQRGRRGVKMSATTISGKKEADESNIDIVKSEETNPAAVDSDMVVEDVDMQELAHEIKDDDARNDNDEGMAFGSTAESAPIGRGMSSFLSLLKQTGEISKHSGKEEMRGRAKDKRTYEDYDKLDLQKVVNINNNNNNPAAATTRHQQQQQQHSDHVHEKDREFATREIKLEYRDDFGRLLTRKEAYRNMCYQFHGHGSSKKNQERRLKQIERERVEAKVASGRGGSGGTLGALRATQDATGKAFVIHKT